MRVVLSLWSRNLGWDVHVLYVRVRRWDGFPSSREGPLETRTFRRRKRSQAHDWRRLSDTQAPSVSGHRTTRRPGSHRGFVDFLSVLDRQCLLRLKVGKRPPSFLPLPLCQSLPVPILLVPDHGTWDSTPTVLDRVFGVLPLYKLGV